MSITEIQEKLREKAKTAPQKVTEDPREVDYSQLLLEEVQARYDKLEEWMRDNRHHPQFFIAKLRLKRMNKAIMEKTKM